MLARITILLLLLFTTSWPAQAADVPALQGHVTDTAKMLSDREHAALERELSNYEQQTSNQIFVLTITSLGDEDIESYANRAFRSYKVGQKDQNNGVLLLVVRDDRRLRIEVGYGLEGTLPDGRAGAIIRDQIQPRFKAGDYDGGMAAGVRAIIGVLSPNYQLPVADQPDQPAEPADQPSPGLPFNPLAPLAILIALFGVGGLIGYTNRRRCPRCHGWHKQTTQTVIKSPTAFSSGYNRQDEYCPDCGYRNQFYYHTAPRGGIFIGGGGFGGGSWGGGGGWSGGGGGDSGGGGASGRW